MLSTYHPILELSNVTSYTYGAKIEGQMYTCHAGFVDFGHLFDYVDATAFYYYYLAKGLRPAPPGGGPSARGLNKQGDKLPIFKEGKMTLKQDVAKADWAITAASMAFDYSVAYEIVSYWQSGGGAHNSAFSPEDLISNYLGTRIAERALNLVGPGKTYDQAVREVVKIIIPLLGPRTKAQTLAAFTAIDGIWVKDAFGPTLPGGIRIPRIPLHDDRYLLRRNVNHRPVRPCYVSDPGIGCTGVPTFPTDIGNTFPDNIRDSYDAEYVIPSDKAPEAIAKLGKTIKKSDFTRLISDITTDPHVGVLCNF
jgi:hypothetical protein